MSIDRYWTSRCEHSPGWFAEYAGRDGDRAQEMYRKCQSGALKVGPAGERGRCGWVGYDKPERGVFVPTQAFSTPGYTCKEYPKVAKDLGLTTSRPWILYAAIGGVLLWFLMKK